MADLILMAGMAITGTVLPNTQMAFSDGKKDIFKMQYPAMSSNVFDIYIAGMAITGTVLPNTQMAFSDGNKDAIPRNVIKRISHNCDRKSLPNQE